ncbi:MoaF protein [Klebsiella pneumoniae]|uniref:MoaF protein n=1 Tax=Klebsiella pneumoniae TaxID=573 RepID=A0A2X1QIV5_KLEPN|nr:MoaF protein [Klebsiella pneumoniae]
MRPVSVFARLDAQPGPLPGFTTALVGMRNQYTYSPTERYEHIYLNDNFYAWQCLDGVEKGLADVDRCHYVQVAEDLYLFVLAGENHSHAGGDPHRSAADAH